MTIKGFHGKKLTLTKEGVHPFAAEPSFDRLILKCGNKVLCRIHVDENFMHVFPKCNPSGVKDIFVSFINKAVKDER